MGFAVSWIAVRNKSPAQVCAALGLAPTGEFSDVPDAPCAGALLPGGWYLVWDNNMEVAFLPELEELSRDTEIVTCTVEEHVLYAEASAWKNGEEVWRIIRDSQNQKGVKDLVVNGQPPPVFTEIRNRFALKHKQAVQSREQVEYLFEIPVEVAKALTGFAHDASIAGTSDEDQPFETLAPRDNGRLGRPKTRWVEAGCFYLTFGIIAFIAISFVLIMLVVVAVTVFPELFQ